MNSIKKAAVFVFMAALLGITPEAAQAGSLRVKPYPEAGSISAGSSGIVTLRCIIPPKHHIYGNPVGPGTGKPTTIQVQSLKGITAGTPRYLPGKKHTYPGDTGFVRVYEGETKFFIPVRVDTTTPPGNYTLSMTVDSLLCSDQSCIPEVVNIDYRLKVLPAGTGAGSLEKPLPEGYGNASEPGETAVAPAGERAGPDERLDGLSFSPQYFASGDVTNIFQAILFGILAGLILNFMPCVLPVVSLKIMSFVQQANEDKGKVAKMGMLFSLGILSVFLVLASLAAFLGYGWGELFKKTSFLVAMTAVVFALSLSMFGVFTISMPSFIGRASVGGKSPWGDAFFKGVLATFLATPCSGPFLGATLAWALLQPPGIIFVIFISVGTGMSLPYLALSLRPGLLRFMPKPGEWMITLERVMGFLLLCTAVYLVGIIESSLVVPTLWFLLFLLGGLWQYGKYGSIINPLRRRIISLVVLVALGAAGYLFSYRYLPVENVAGERGEQRQFSLEKLLENRDRGIITIIKFTADWCPNCKLVESTSLYTRDVIKAMKDNEVSLLVADITRSNTTAEQLLKKLGSQSIPFLAVFPPGAAFSRPLCLRDIYSEEDVLTAIKEAKKSIPALDVESIQFRVR